MFKSVSIISLIVRLFNPNHDEDGVPKGKIKEPVACVVDDACNMCKSNEYSDRCLTCRP